MPRLRQQSVRDCDQGPGSCEGAARVSGFPHRNPVLLVGRMLVRFEKNFAQRLPAGIQRRPAIEPARKESPPWHRAAARPAKIQSRSHQNYRRCFFIRISEHTDALRSDHKIPRSDMNRSGPPDCRAVRGLTKGERVASGSAPSTPAFCITCPLTLRNRLLPSRKNAAPASSSNAYRDRARPGRSCWKAAARVRVVSLTSSNCWTPLFS